MADYVAREWSNGDIVTAANLNNIEQGVAGVDIDLGYSCTEELVVLTEESVTTVIEGDNSGAIGDFTYSEDITADAIKVTFNGTEYNNIPVVVETAPFGTIYVYGALWSDELDDYDFSTYPFTISSDSGTNSLITQIAGTYQIKIEALEKTVETSECFKKAVESVRTGAFQVRAVSRDAETGLVTYNCSISQLQSAFLRGDYITFYDKYSNLIPLMLRDCIVDWDNDTPILVGMVNYVTRQTTASNSQVTTLKIRFNIPSSPDETLTSGGGK